MPDEESRFWFANYVDERMKSTDDAVHHLRVDVDELKKQMDNFHDVAATLSEVTPILRKGADVIEFFTGSIRFFNSAKKLVVWFAALSMWFWGITHTGDFEQTIGRLWPF